MTQKGKYISLLKSLETRKPQFTPQKTQLKSKNEKIPLKNRLQLHNTLRCGTQTKGKAINLGSLHIPKDTLVGFPFLLPSVLSGLFCV